jgi:hypothetical protein
MPRCAGGPGSRIPAVTTRTGFGFQLKGCESQTRSQRRSPRRRWLRDAPLTDERQPDDVTRGLRGLCLCRRTLHIPSGRLVPARGALEGHPALLEVQQRVMAVKTAQELPHVPGRAADQAGRCFCCCAGLWLPGFRPHLPSSPFLGAVPDRVAESVCFHITRPRDSPAVFKSSAREWSRYSARARRVGGIRTRPYRRRVGGSPPTVGNGWAIYSRGLPPTAREPASGSRTRHWRDVHQADA